jgi:Glycosyl transferase family 11
MRRTQMLSFPRLGTHVRLGNQLFQYAFLRTAARRLGVPFYCPPWRGDEIFTLHDAGERVAEPRGITKIYRPSPTNCGFDEAALRIEDGTEINGHFQSERYWPDAAMVRRWFTFVPEIARAAERTYAHVDFARATSVHVRFGDMERKVRYYRPRLRYYRNALAATARHETVLVFSDEIPKARRLLRSLDAPFFFVEGNEDYLDLYVMSLCHDNVCSPSTFSWWGAWLNRAPDKVVVVPREGALRPGAGVVARDFWCEGWTPIRALRGVVDDYRLRAVPRKLRRALRL